MDKLIAVVGATASGKSSLAMSLAKSLGGEIVNTDSMQVYRYLDIGTSKPTTEDRGRVTHHLLDVVDPDDFYSAGSFLQDARRVIIDIRSRGRVPILCGGTGLYFRALLFGMSDIPAVTQHARNRAANLLRQEGLAACHAALAEVDAVSARRIHPNDPSRIVRALEVYYTTGKALSTFHESQPFRANAPNVLSVARRWERADLYERIDERVRAMLDMGWIGEVGGLLERGYSADLKPMRAIGYREIAALLEHRRTRERLAEDIATRTRHYAKRQLTWFNKHPGIHWAHPLDDGALHRKASEFLETAG